MEFPVFCTSPSHETILCYELPLILTDLADFVKSIIAEGRVKFLTGLQSRRGRHLCKNAVPAHPKPQRGDICIGLLTKYLHTHRRIQETTPSFDKAA